MSKCLHLLNNIELSMFYVCVHNKKSITKREKAHSVRRDLERQERLFNEIKQKKICIPHVYTYGFNARCF